MTENKIVRLIKKVSGTKKKFKNSDNLISNEILDSMSIIILISELEKILKIKIKMNTFNINAISTVNNIKKYLKKISK